MAGAARRTAAVIGLTAAALTVAACSGGSDSPAQATGAGAYGKLAQRVLHAPTSMLAATELSAHGTIWALTGPDSAGLFEISSATGRVKTSFSVSDDARSVAESSTGIIALALASAQSGALELVNGETKKVTRTVPLPGPAEQVTVGRDGSTFYVLTTRASAAKVMIVDGRSGRVTGTVAVPSDVASVVPDTRQASLYAIERDGLVDQIGLRNGKLMAKIRAGSGGGESVTLSPDGRTLYVLEQLGGIANIAIVDPAAGAVRKVLPAPGTCVQVLVSPSGGQLYEVVRAPRSGSIQVAAA
jgi:DNA-binding beta-propeller fold protein YncE